MGGLESITRRPGFRSHLGCDWMLMDVCVLLTKQFIMKGNLY